MSAITLRVLRNTEFPTLYEKLLVGSPLKNREKQALLEMAIILINAGDENTQDLAYRVVVLYGNRFLNYEPLYDMAVNKGYYPITKAIETEESNTPYFDETFLGMLLSSHGETYKSKGIYLTSQQAALLSHFNANVDNGVAVVAPTSYGKSELFVNFCEAHEKSTIAIIVPTKALLAQIKKRVLHGRKNSGRRRKIITHPEMYNEGDSGFIGILTQERLLRMLQDHRELGFDYVFVDEAHNLLSGDQRNILLAKVISILNHRRKDTAFSYLTPFLINSENLNTKYTKQNFSEFKVSEHLKTEKYYVVDLRSEGDGNLKIYDQYMDNFVNTEIHSSGNEVEFVEKYSGRKNIIYLNSPPKLEKFAVSLAKKLKPIKSEDVLSACNDISELLHKDYALLDCLKNGVVYHHGSVPDVVRLYIENLYSTVSDIKYVISSSTLLEGVNIPAEKLFILDCKKGRGNLSASQLKNLVGRICRFREIFDPQTGSLQMLEPEIYVVASKYMPKNSNIETFLRSRMKVDKKIKDKLENVLLEATPINDANWNEMNKANEILENLQPGITGTTTEYAKTNLGKSCYNNNISEFEILEHEQDIAEFLENFINSEGNIETSETLMEVIHKAFINYIPEEENRNLKRLAQDSAKRFYRMFLEWRMRNASYAEMIKRFLDYWASVDDPFVYVDKWGDTARPGYHLERWVDISEKTNKQRVNLAIVRIKEEQDFLDNKIMKFVEVLNDMDILENDFYTKIKYGTTDNRKITLLKNGFSAGLASLLLERYSDHLNINTDENTVFLGEHVEEAMLTAGENKIHVFEASFYTTD